MERYYFIIIIKLLDINLSHIKSYFWEVLVKMHRFYCIIRRTCKKKRHIFAFGYFWEVLMVIPCFFESRLLRFDAIMTIFGWPHTLATNSRGGG